MEVKELPINSIKVLENVRVKIEKLQGLMQDIKQHGLYNPIKVSKTAANEYILVQGHRRLTACSKLGWKKIPCTVSEDMELSELLLNNMAENIHREDISPVELGRICKRLQDDFDMNSSEISAKLSLPVSRINSAIKTYKGLPDKYRKHVSYTGIGKSRVGDIPASVAMHIINCKKAYGLSDASVDKLLKISKVEEYGVAELHIINLFLKEGLSVTQSIESAKKYQFLRTDVIVDNDEIESLLNKHKMDSRQNMITAILYGELPPLTRPSWLKAKEVPVKG